MKATITFNVDGPLTEGESAALFALLNKSGNATKTESEAGIEAVSTVATKTVTPAAPAASAAPAAESEKTPAAPAAESEKAPATPAQSEPETAPAAPAAVKYPEQTEADIRKTMNDIRSKIFGPEWQTNFNPKQKPVYDKLNAKFIEVAKSLGADKPTDLAKKKDYNACYNFGEICRTIARDKNDEFVFDDLPDLR